MITITNNYFTDLNAALEAGIIAKVGGKNPKKSDLYEAIEAHNAEQVSGVSGQVLDNPLKPETQNLVDEVALQDELLALDAVEDAAKAEQRTQMQVAKKVRKAPTEILTELAQISADVELHGRQAIAEQLGTSVGRLVKRVKAYKIMQNDQRVLNAFIGGKLAYTFLQEAAVRRDGLQLIEARLQASA